MASSAPMFHLALPISGHAACTRRPSRGRPQRCSQGQSQEAARTSSVRFGSRGSSGSRRSRSSSCNQRPSSEVDLRREERNFDEAEDSCANSFVCDLIGDAVDDFTDDLIHNVDDEEYLEDQLVLSAGEPAIFEELNEEIDEDEDICSAAEIFTARAAEEAISFVEFGSPSWSVQANASSPVRATTSLDVESQVVARQLDLCVADDDALSCSSRDEYEEVYGLGSDDEQETDEELESMAYVSMAVNLAKAAVDKGCHKAVEDELPAALEELELEEKHVEFLGEGPACNEELAFDMTSDILDMAFTITFDSTVQEEQEWTRMHTVDEFPAQLEEAEQEEEDMEFLGEGLACGEEMAFDFTNDILGGAFMQATATWEAQGQDEFLAGPTEEEEELEDLRQQAMTSLQIGLDSGALETVLNNIAKKREMDTLKAKARDALVKAAKVCAAEKAAKAEKEQRTNMLAEKAKATLVKAAMTGTLVPTLKSVREADKMKELQKKVQSTLFKAAREGRLVSTLQEVAPKNVDTVAPPTVDHVAAMKQMAHEAVSKAAASGALTSVFREAIRNSKSAEAKSTEVLLPPAAVTPAAPAEIVNVTCKAPATPSRTRRRVIGGVVRTPSAVELQLEVPSASPTSTSRSERKSKSSRKLAKEAPKAIRLDLGDDSGEDCSNGSSWNRESSLTRGYDSLGSQFHVLNSPSSSSAPKTMKLDVDRPSSKAGSRLRAASTSAMTMDLGGSFSSTSSSRTPAASPSHQGSAFRMEGQKMRPSASLGSLQATKVSKLPGGLLPILSTKKASGESIAWTMQMSKSASMWGNTGLRGSASMVF